MAWPAGKPRKGRDEDDAVYQARLAAWEQAQAEATPEPLLSGDETEVAETPQNDESKPEATEEPSVEPEAQVEDSEAPQKASVEPDEAAPAVEKTPEPERDLRSEEEDALKHLQNAINPTLYTPEQVSQSSSPSVEAAEEAVEAPIAPTAPPAEPVSTGEVVHLVMEAYPDAKWRQVEQALRVGIANTGFLGGDTFNKMRAPGGLIDQILAVQRGEAILLPPTEKTDSWD